MARLADDLEQGSTETGKISIRHRSYVIRSVMESAAYMEAFINEIFRTRSTASLEHSEDSRPARWPRSRMPGASP